MADLGTRIFRLVQAWGAQGMEAIEQALKAGNRVEEVLEDFEQQQGSQEPAPEKNKPTPWPQELVEDLAVFGLHPPATLEKVKQLRKAALQQYHPDHFQQEPEKLETAKQIAQIYNQAYERLKKHPQMQN